MRNGVHEIHTILRGSHGCSPRGRYADTCGEPLEVGLFKGTIGKLLFVLFQTIIHNARLLQKLAECLPLTAAHIAPYDFSRMTLSAFARGSSGGLRVFPGKEVTVL